MVIEATDNMACFLAQTLTPNKMLALLFNQVVIWQVWTFLYPR